MDKKRKKGLLILAIIIFVIISGIVLYFVVPHINQLHDASTNFYSNPDNAKEKSFSDIMASFTMALSMDEEETARELFDSIAPDESDPIPVEEPRSDSSANTSSLPVLEAPKLPKVEQEHVHNWVPVTSLVHHPAVGHYEIQEVESAWDEPVYETHLICDKCNSDITLFPGGPEAHQVHCNGTYSEKEIQTGTLHHDPVFDNVWVVDVEEWDEQVITGYICYECMATKGVEETSDDSDSE